MSDDLFEVAFSGQVSDGSDLDNVKARVGKMFNADERKLNKLFSGKRVVIKKNISKETADKYLKAFAQVGAVAEAKSIALVVESSPVTATESIQESRSESAAIPQVKPTTPPVPEAQPPLPGETDFTVPPKTDPLGITGDQIDDLVATVAPVGSTLHEEAKEVEVTTYDLSGLEVAPVGSQIGASKKEADPPPPDTGGLSMAD